MKEDFCSEKNFEVSVKFKLNSMGKISEISFDKSNPTNEYDEFFLKLLEGMPAVDTTNRFNHFKIDTKTYSLEEYYHLSFVGDSVFSKSKFEKKYESFRNKAITKIDKAELNYYILTATKFGWINCDRFWNIPDEKIEFFVKTKSPNDAKIFITFKDISSIMQGEQNGDKFVFSNIPINQAIKVIGISFNNGKPTMGVAETKTDKDGFELSVFNEITLDQLEAELNKMN